MAIRKWMTKYRLIPGSCKRDDHWRKIPLAMAYCLCAAGFLNADFTTGVRVLPSVSIPLKTGVFTQGFGMTTALDFMPKSYFGFFVQGEYISMGMNNVDPLILKGGSAGAGLVWRPADRISVRGDAMVGLYSAVRDNVDLSGISAGVRVTGNYHITPALKASIHAGINRYAYTPEPLMDTVSAGAGSGFSRFLFLVRRE